MSLEDMYRVHLVSMDKQGLYRERREAATLAKTLLHFILFAETGSEKRFAMHAGVALRESLWAGFQRSVFFLISCCRLLDLFHLCDCHGHVPGGMHETRCLHPSIMLHTYEVYARQHDAIKHQEGRMFSSASHVSNKMLRHFLSQSAATKSDRCWNVTCVTCVYLYVKNSRLCVISASKAKC
jgi:hypothetical protein